MPDTEWTTEDVRQEILRGFREGSVVRMRRAARFDAAMAAHDAEVRSEAYREWFCKDALVSRGYYLVPCADCGGSGRFPVPDGYDGDASCVACKATGVVPLSMVDPDALEAIESHDAEVAAKARDEGGVAALRIAAREGRALLERVYAGSKTASVRQMLDAYDVILDQAADVIETSAARAADLRGGAH